LTTTPARPALSLADLPVASDREAAWQALLDQGPLVDVDGAVFVVGNKAVDVVLHDPATYSSRLAFGVVGSPVPMVPIAFDPPEHMRYRKLLAPFFSPVVVGRMYESLREQLRALITPLAEAGRCDVVRDLAVPFPSQVFLTLLGLPLSDTERLVRWKDAVLAAAGPAGASEGQQAEALELFTYLGEKIEQRRGQPGEDLLTVLVNDTSAEAMSQEELLGLGFLMVLAGLDTVTATLGFAFELLARDADLRGRLAQDLTLVPGFVEELVRLNPVATFTPRVTTQDTVLEGRDLPAGTRVVMVWAAANRDPDRYEDGTAVQLDRDEAHWGFGGGIHRCLGSHLARAELRLVLEEWLTQVPDFALQPGTTPVLPWPAGLLGFPSVELTYGGART
jgi:cytochrome P450